MDEWMDGLMDGGMDGWMNGCTNGWMSGWMDEWMDGLVDGSFVSLNHPILISPSESHCGACAECPQRASASAALQVRAQCERRNLTSLAGSSVV